MKIKRILILLLLVFFILSPVTVLAQQTNPTPLSEGTRSWIAKMGSWTLFFIIIGGGLIAAGVIFGFLHPSVRKYLVVIGLGFIVIGLFGVEAVYLTPFLGKPAISYQVCDQVFTTVHHPTSSLPDPVVNVLTYTSCIFSGYVPSELTWLGITAFIIFGIISPLGILMALFWEFTDFLYNPNVRRVLAFLSSLIAFRFLLASLFLDILGYGFAGVGILLVDFFLFMIVFRATSRLWRGYEEVGEILAAQDRELLDALLAKRDNLKVRIKSLRKGTPEWNEARGELEDTEKKIKKLARKLKLK